MNSKSRIAGIIKENLEKSVTRKVFISPIATNEEILLAKTVAANMNAQIGSLSYREYFMDRLYDTNVFTTSFDELKRVEAIVVIGKIAGTLKNIIRAEQRKGKKLIIIDQEKEPWHQFADELMDFYSISESLEKILDYYCIDSDDDLIEDAEDMTVEAKIFPKTDIQLDLPQKTLFIYNRDHVSEDIVWNIWNLATILTEDKS